MPVQYPDNSLTQMMERVSALNAAGGGRRGGVAHTGEPLPSVQSAAMRAPAEPIEEPLSDAEKAELDRLAIQAGVKDERLGNVGTAAASNDPAQGQYENMSMEEVLAIANGPGGPPTPEPVITRQGPRGPVARSLGGRVAAPAAPAPAAPARPPAPRLPNFKNVQGIDLMSGDVLVDDMAFKMPESDLAALRKYVVEVARGSIMEQLEEAMNLFTQETAEDEDGGDDFAPEGADEAVQPDTEGDRPEPAE